MARRFGTGRDVGCVAGAGAGLAGRAAVSPCGGVGALRGGGDGWEGGVCKWGGEGVAGGRLGWAFLGLWMEGIVGGVEVFLVSTVLVLAG